jgi:hypothetical protein
MRSLLLVENFDLHPSNQYILVMMIPSGFRFANICLCQVSPVKVQPEIFDIVHCLYGGGRVYFRVVNATWIDMDPLAFNCAFFKTSFGLLVGSFVCVKQWLDHCPWLLLVYHWQRLLW